MRQPKPCSCGCGALTWGTFKRGHEQAFLEGKPPPADTNVSILEDELELSSEPEALPVSAPSIADGPPVGGPIDRRRWRLASERPNIPKTDPWIKTKCHGCLSPMWTHDPLSIWEQGGVCEECDYIIRTQLSVNDKRQFGVQQRVLHDPFRPR